MQDERRKQIIDIWKAIVEVQQHFNDISMRIRSMFVTILLALFASLGFLLDKKLQLKIGALNIQFVTLVPLFGILGTYLFYFIDRYWYHRLLVGSVKHAITIEKKYEKEIPELSVSQAIGAESPYKPRRFVRWLANLLVSHDKYRETGQLHSDGKIELFYKSVVLALLLTTIMLACLGGVIIEGKAPATLPTSVTATAPPPPPAPAPAGLPVTAPPTPAPTAPAARDAIFRDAAPIISALVTIAALFATLFAGWRRSRESALRRGDILAWANEVIHELQSLLLVSILGEPQLEAASAKAKLVEIMFNTSILVERGRLFFRNQIVDDHGQEKEPAYRGYRPKILDPIVVAHQIARGWAEANEDTRLRLRMRLIAEDCLKKFVSLVQKEVGRNRTASADTGKGGDSVHLPRLLDTVNGDRLERLSARINALSVSIPTYTMAETSRWL